MVPSEKPVATSDAAGQVAFVVSLVNGPATAVVSEREPIVLLKQADPQPDGTTVLRVFEGCNGLNVMIVFASFIIAFGGRIKSILTFLLVGFFLLHIFNLLRIVLLYYTALYRPLFFYYFHKYFFTAVLYLAVFGLWIMWTRMKSKNSAAVQA